MRIFLLAASLALASSALVAIEFTALQKSTTQKLVIFHDPNVAKSMEKYAVLEALDAAGTYGAEYEYTVCDVTAAANVEPIKGAGFKEFPMIFTQTPEGGIAPFGGELTAESFAAFHEFSKMEVSSDKVQRMKGTDGKGEVEGAAGVLALAAERPVLVKMYEEWCGHCKKMKKHFQYVSNMPADKTNNAVMLEVECSKVGGTFCNDMGTTGFPTVMLVFEGKAMKYTGGRTHGAMAEFLGDKSKWVMEALPAKVAAGLPAAEAGKAEL